MINSLCGSMGSLTSENTCTKLEQSTTSPNNKSISESRKAPLNSDFESNSLVPSSLNLHGLKFDVDHGDANQVQSPDSCSMWESFFTDQFDSDFMISSPVRISPMNYNHNYVQGQGQGQSLLGCSPPRSSIGSFSSSNSQRGKGQSPLHKVFNSPTYQYIQPDTLSLPPLETLLDDYHRDGVGPSSYPTIKMPPAVGISGTSTLGQYMEMPVTIHPAAAAALDLPLHNTSRFCGSVSESSATGASQLTQTQENDIYQIGSIASPAPLSLQLQQEHRQEQQLQQKQKQLQEIHNLNHTLMMPHPLGSEQVSFSHPMQFKSTWSKQFSFCVAD